MSDTIEEILVELERVTNFMRGMTWDQRIPTEIKNCLIGKVRELDRKIEKIHENLDNL